MPTTLTEYRCDLCRRRYTTLGAKRPDAIHYISY